MKKVSFLMFRDKIIQEQFIKNVSGFEGYDKNLFWFLIINRKEYDKRRSVYLFLTE